MGEERIFSGVDPVDTAGKSVDVEWIAQIPNEIRRARGVRSWR